MARSWEVPRAGLMESRLLAPAAAVDQWTQADAQQTKSLLDLPVFVIHGRTSLGRSVVTPNS